MQLTAYSRDKKGDFYPEISYHRESANLGASFSWVQKCSAEGSFKGINLFHLVLDTLSSVIFNFFFKSNTVETSEFLITQRHISADPKLINEQQQNSMQHNSNSMSCTEVYFT